MKKIFMGKVVLVVGISLFLLTLFQGSALSKQFNWKFHSYVPPANKALAVGQRWWCEQVDKRSKGELKVKMYWVGQLVGPKELLGAVSSGVLDVAGCAPNYTPGQIPLWNIFTLPFICAPRPDYGLMIYNRMARESRPLIDEMKEQNLVYGGGHDMFPKNIVGKKPVRTISDFKGLRLRCNPDVGSLLRKFGGVPTMLPVSEVYSALDTGVIDALSFAPEALPQWKIHEICKNLTLDLDLASMVVIYFINRDKWNQLPDNLKKVVQSVIEDYPAFLWSLASRMQEESSKTMKQAGVEFIDFPKTEKEKLLVKAPDIWEQWAKRHGKYDAAKAVLGDFQRIRDDIVSK
jgi:TRAP-type C4-dicarboxylate transport system substrate-binding protein